MSLLEQLIRNDLVSQAVREALAVRQKKTTRTGFTDICCPMCVQRRQPRPDRKFRCGIIFTNGIGINCFNCGLKAQWRVGDRLTHTMRQFLIALGVSSQEVSKLAYWATQIHVMLGSQPELQAKLELTVMPDYPGIKLPEQAKTLERWLEDGCDDPNLLETVEYLLSRGSVVQHATSYYWSPTLPRRLVIPCYQDHRLVGWTARGISDDVEPKYWKETPANFLFNTEFMTAPYRRFVMIVEGVFDAMAIDGVAALGASLNDVQIAWIRQCQKQPIVIADRDETGRRLVEIAIEQQWPVATMHYGRNQWWDADVKDADAAVKRYGRLYTIQSILANLTWNKEQIRQRVRYVI